MSQFGEIYPFCMMQFSEVTGGEEKSPGDSFSRLRGEADTRLGEVSSLCGSGQNVGQFALLGLV